MVNGGGSGQGARKPMTVFNQAAPKLLLGVWCFGVGGGFAIGVMASAGSFGSVGFVALAAIAAVSLGVTFTLWLDRIMPWWVTLEPHRVVFKSLFRQVVVTSDMVARLEIANFDNQWGGGSPGMFEQGSLLLTVKDRPTEFVYPAIPAWLRLAVYRSLRGNTIDEKFLSSWGIKLGNPRA